MHISRVRQRLAVSLAPALAALLIVGCNHNRADSTTGTSGRGFEVEEIDIGRSLNADKSIGDNTASFKPNDTIYVSIKTDGSAPSAQLKARWIYSDGQVVDESTQTIAPTGEARTEFHIAKPDGFPPGKYKAEIYVNEKLAGTKDFEVERP